MSKGDNECVDNIVEPEEHLQGPKGGGKNHCRGHDRADMEDWILLRHWNSQDGRNACGGTGEGD